MKVNGAATGAPVTVALSSLTGPTEGEGSVALSGGGSVKYYDVKVSGNVGGGATSTVCMTDPTIATTSQMAYWNGATWVLLNSIVTGATICTTVTNNALAATNFAVGSGFVSAQTVATITTVTTVPSPGPSSGSTSSQGGSSSSGAASSSSSSASSSSGQGIAEFPFQLSAVFLMTMILVVSFLAARRRVLGLRSGPV